MTDNQIFIEVEPEHEFRIKVFVPWQRKDWITKIKSLPDRAWNREEKYWSVPKSEATIQNLKKLFGTNLNVSADIQLLSNNDKKGKTNISKLNEGSEMAITSLRISNHGNIHPLSVDPVRIYMDGFCKSSLRYVVLP